MRDDDTSVAALIAGYRACERPSPATKAKIARTLADARRRPTRRATSLPWLALAAALVLLLAWQAGLGRRAGRRSDDAAGLSSFAATKVRESTTTPRPSVVAAPRPAAPGDERPSEIVTPAAATQRLHEPAPPAPAPASESRRRKSAPRAPTPAATDAGSAVLEEMALLQRAQDALRTDRPDEALALLTEHVERFPRGALAEEREALRVAALCDAGELQRGDAARTAFLRTYRRSPHAARVLAACAAAPEASIDLEGENVHSP